ncbi:hypothetical protein [Variovorax paradoxus]|nr:hypothetical protein [Variovorax paradoxus]MDQ0586541.1 hypothetical protein [Variovorax paradoxus]
MNGIQIERANSATGASSTCDEINGIFFSRGVLRHSGKAAAPVGLAA